MRGAVLSAFFGMVLTFATAFGATAQQADIESTITGQFEAFKADDFEGAFAYASPNLQMMFQSTENFKRMVTSGYPMVWKNTDVRFLDLREIAGAQCKSRRCQQQTICDCLVHRHPLRRGCNVAPHELKNTDVRFLDLREIAGAQWQKVQVTDLKGFTYLLDYQMVETPEGWRIASVQLLDAPSVSA